MAQMLGGVFSMNSSVFLSKSVLFFLLEGWKDACASCENNSKSTRNRELPRIRPSTKTNKKRRLPELLKKGKPWLVNLISFYESTFLSWFDDQPLPPLPSQDVSTWLKTSWPIPSMGLVYFPTVGWFLC